MTRKIILITMVLVLTLIPMTLAANNGNGGSGNGSGGNGNNGNGGGSGNGSGDGTGPVHDILAGTPFNYSGAVVSIGYQGDGMEIATSDGNVVVYGLGSQRYWDSLGIELPDVGEQVVAEGYTVDFNGVARNILMSIEINGVLVQLRDPDTGTPLWRGEGNENRGGSGNMYSRGEPRLDILAGVPFTITGEVVSFGEGSSYNGSNGNGGGNGSVTISTASGNVVVCGLGPFRYWDGLGVDYPVVGDSLEASGFTVDVNGIAVNVVMSVTIGGTTVQLRDDATGLPLWWRGNCNNGN